MDKRLENENAIVFGELKMPPQNPNETDLKTAIAQLEDCVKNGLFYQAAELSDWTAFVGDKQLLQYPLLARRLELERLKRLGYLGFIDEEKICQEKFCDNYELDKVLNSSSNGELDQIRYDLFTAIGHTLWHTREKDKKKVIETFNKNIEVCGKLYELITDQYKNKKVVEAFLHGLRGRQAYLTGKNAKVVMGHFDQGLASLSEEDRRKRMGLHLIIYYAEHLLLIFENAKKKDIQIIRKKINQLFDEFENCRLGTPIDGKLRPTKTLLQIHFLVLKLKKLAIDNKTVSKDQLDKLKNEIEHAKTDLLFTTRMLGLGHLNPCPPLLKDIYQFFNDQRDQFDESRVKEHFKNMLRKIDWESMEEVARVYFEQRSYKVTKLGKNAPTFDLLAKFYPPHGGTPTTTGVQVKHWGSKFILADFKKWLFGSDNSEHSFEVSYVMFFLTEEPSESAFLDNIKLSRYFPKLLGGIEFITLDKAVDKLWQQDGCLPLIYGIIHDAKPS